MNTYEDYKKVTDKQHLSKAKRMPIRFLKASGKGFFVEKDGYALALRDEIGDVVWEYGVWRADGGCAWVSEFGVLSAEVQKE